MAGRPKKDLPRVTVTDRRIEARLRNPFGSPSVPIQFKDAGKVARWMNDGIIEGKVWNHKTFGGWNLTKPEDLADPEQLGGFSLHPSGGHICRGERHKEVLMWMWKDDYDAITRAKIAANNRDMGNPHAQKTAVVEAASRQLGDEAADFLNRGGGMSGGVTDTIERIERTGDLE